MLRLVHILYVGSNQVGWQETQGTERRVQRGSLCCTNDVLTELNVHSDNDNMAPVLEIWNLHWWRADRAECAEQQRQHGSFSGDMEPQREEESENAGNFSARHWTAQDGADELNNMAPLWHIQNRTPIYVRLCIKSLSGVEWSLRCILMELLIAFYNKWTWE